MQLGVPVRVFDTATVDDLGVVRVPVPVEPGDALAVEGYASPLEVVEVVETSPGAAVAALVKVRPARRHLA
jgi:hypothetical protein